jgi:2-iminobutanoate/2-iminopropanoate deaminase
MTAVTTFHTDKAPAAVGPYSQACGTDSLVFVSGQLGIDPSAGALKEGFEPQARQALANLAAILEASGASLETVLSVEVFLTDMGRFKEFNAIYAEFFSAHKPARAAIEVSALPLGGLVEVKCAAVRKA